jgi:predicted acetyltransferase
MKNTYFLKVIERKDEEAYLNYIKTWENEPKIVPFSSGLRGRTFEAFLTDLELSNKGLIEPFRFVPDQTFILVDEENVIFGALNLRFYLNEHLYQTGGHIGYGICPNNRAKGLGTLMLKLGLEKAKSMGLTSVLITVNQENLASKKVIINCGGVLENILTFPNETIERYWISLMAV